MWYLFGIFLCDIITIVGYSACVCLIYNALRTLQNLLKDEAMSGGNGINARAARFHLALVLIFWTSLLVYEVTLYICTIEELFFLHHRSQDRRINLLAKNIGTLILLIGQFVGFMILLRMFWRYTIIHEVL